MRELGGTTVTRGVVVAMLSVGVAAGSFALSGMQHSLAQIADLTPAQTVAYRFPSNWHAITAAPSRPTSGSTPSTIRHAAPPVRDTERTAVASLFNPEPAYSLASASSRAVTLPDQSNAYADPSADGSRPLPPDRLALARPQMSPADKPQADKPKTASTAKLSNNGFNDAQIASIKARLRLTADQQRHWPPVEAALRNIIYKKDSVRGGKMAAVDPNSPGVQQLKSSAVPLILSFSEEQKNEVRQLARLMGLEQVASSF